MNILQKMKLLVKNPKIPKYLEKWEKEKVFVCIKVNLF